MLYPSSRRFQKRSRIKHYLFGAVGIAVIALVLVTAVAGIYAYNKTSPVTITVTDKERATTGSGDSLKSEYRVYTESGTYKVTDTLLHGRFDSADEYGKLTVGKTYRCKAYGVRLPFFSSFKNLLDCTEVSR